VKPERDQNNRATYRNNWWIFGEARKDWRAMVQGLPRYIATIETTKHRVFQYLDAEILPDNMLVCVGADDAYLLGVLSSRLGVTWALAAGGTLEDRPRYNKSVCFETFPFPQASPEQQQSIGNIAEQIDNHRKRQQAEHASLTLTGMYNVMEKLRSGDTLTAKEKAIHEQGLVSVLRELHDQLDRAVFEAYGWDDLADKLVGLPGATTPLPDKPEAQAEAEEELLLRLVALNAQRTAEEARGQVRWLRPSYQNPSEGAQAHQTEIEVAGEETDATTTTAASKQTWPKNMREQVAAVRTALQVQPMSVEAIASQFKRSPKVAVQAVLGALEELGMVRQDDGNFRLAT